MLRFSFFCKSSDQTLPYSFLSVFYRPNYRLASNAFAGYLQQQTQPPARNNETENIYMICGTTLGNAP